MSQQAPDLPRSVQTITRYRALIGAVALLGAFVGFVLGALNPPTSTSRALVVFTAPACPAGGICGGPMFSAGYFQAMVLKEFPNGVQVKPAADGVVAISATAGTAARAEALAAAAAHEYITDTGSMSYMGEFASAQIVQPATITATGTTPAKQLARDALAGAALGALLGIIAALAGAQTVIDPPTLPREVGVIDRETGQQAGGLTLRDLAQEYAGRTAIGGSPFDG